MVLESHGDVVSHMTLRRGRKGERVRRGKRLVGESDREGGEEEDDDNDDGKGKKEDVITITFDGLRLTAERKACLRGRGGVAWNNASFVDDGHKIGMNLVGSFPTPTDALNHIEIEIWTLISSRPRLQGLR